jgi:hypothetical protein
MTLSLANRTKLLGRGILICIKCEEPKKVEEFAPQRSGPGGYRPRCKVCMVEDQLKYNLKYLYNVSLEEFREMEQRQGGRCALCENPPEPKEDRLGVFLNRKTKAFQALLCVNCVQALGKFGHDPEQLRVAARFLESG